MGDPLILLGFDTFCKIRFGADPCFGSVAHAVRMQNHFISIVYVSFVGACGLKVWQNVTSDTLNILFDMEKRHEIRN